MRALKKEIWPYSMFFSGSREEITAFLHSMKDLGGYMKDWTYHYTGVSEWSIRIYSKSPELITMLKLRFNNV